MSPCQRPGSIVCEFTEKRQPAGIELAISPAGKLAPAGSPGGQDAARDQTKEAARSGGQSGAGIC